MTNLSNEARRILEALRANVESTSQKDDGSVWGMVYLDNAQPSNVSAHSFAGYLSALESAGFYRSMNDGCFGLVLMAPVAEKDEDDLDLGEWEPCPDDADASKADAEIVRRMQEKARGTSPTSVQAETVILHAEDFVPADNALAQIEAIMNHPMNQPHNIEHKTFVDARDAAQERANELGYAIAITTVTASSGKVIWYHASTPQECRENGRAQETFIYPHNGFPKKA